MNALSLQATRPMRRTQAPAQRIIAPLALATIILIVWQAVTAAGMVHPFFLPAPTDIAARVGSDLAGPAMNYLGPTILAAVLGSLLALAIALPLAIAISLSKLARDTLEPFVAASQALPAVAVAPLLVLWLGYGFAPVIVLCALMVFFPILVASTHGLLTVPSDVVDAARLDGAGAAKVLWHIQLPLALPAILSGIRTGFTLSITGAIVGEIVTGGQGMGLLLSSRAAAADTTGLFSALTILCALAVLIFITIGLAQRRVTYLREGTS